MTHHGPMFMFQAWLRVGNDRYVKMVAKASIPAQLVGELSNVRGDAPSFVLRQQLGDRGDF